MYKIVTKCRFRHVDSRELLHSKEGSSHGRLLHGKEGRSHGKIRENLGKLRDNLGKLRDHLGKLRDNLGKLLRLQEHSKEYSKERRNVQVVRNKLSSAGSEIVDRDNYL